MKLNFGKYKGTRIVEMTSKEQTQYLFWLINSEINLTPSLRAAIKKHLNIK